MKLLDRVSSWENKGWFEKLPKDSVIIGTCKDCKYISDTETDCPYHNSLTSQFEDKNFGCIKWGKE
tara:strand:+ start:33 stop:230 length:198 start_codon:yes stop_codon:yes gene_type:complete